MAGYLAFFDLAFGLAIPLARCGGGHLRTGICVFKWLRLHQLRKELLFQPYKPGCHLITHHLYILFYLFNSFFRPAISGSDIHQHIEL